MGFSYKPIRFDDMNSTNYLQPIGEIATSYAEIVKNLMENLPDGLIILDGFLTANFATLLENIQLASPEIITVEVSRFFLPAKEIQKFFAPYLPQDREIDPELIFGKLYDQYFQELLDMKAVDDFLSNLTDGQKVLLYGFGSSSEPFKSFSKAILYIDVIPKDVALRVNDGLYCCLGNQNGQDLVSVLRQTYFVDIELAVRLRRDLIQHDQIDFYFLDSEVSYSMLNRNTFHRLMDQLKIRPLRPKPIYVEGVWGGQFIKRVRGIPVGLVDKVAWSFELIHTEASVLVDSESHLLDLPFLTIMDSIGEWILGKKLYNQFGGWFPVRFNYDDSWHSDGNMSIQCHPDDETAQKRFGDFAGQNEAYYIVLTGHDAKTYFGFKDDGREFLKLAQQSEVENQVIPYQNHIHATQSVVGQQILLPAGTIHSSGRNQLVLELGTLTINTYTYKIYDYTRLDITGKPRPLHTKLANQVLRFERNADWVMKYLSLPPKLIQSGEGWREYLIGHYDDIYFDTHRIEIETGKRYVGENIDGFSVLAVVDGESITIRSLAASSCSYDAKYLDVVLIPASIQSYEVITNGTQPVVLHKTFVRKDFCNHE